MTLFRKILSLTILLLTVSLFTACDSDSEEPTPEELYNQGIVHGLKNDISEITLVVDYFEPAAVEGHARAQYMLGEYYYYGKGVHKDKDEAVKWFRKAAEQGIAD